ncbi:MAG: hypothetical protein Q9219_001451 [cf. Caloplaca sp. 3 TL-2023]
MSHSRTLLRILPRSNPLARRTFTTTRPTLVNIGDAIPNIELVEGSPGNKVNLATELKGKGKGLVIGVPAAFISLPLILSLQSMLAIPFSSTGSINGSVGNVE